MRFLRPAVFRRPHASERRSFLFVILTTAVLGLPSSGLAATILTQDESRAFSSLHLLDLGGQQGIAHSQVNGAHTTSSVISFTSGSLAGADVVYLSPAKTGVLNLSLSEILSLESFVNNGGRLILPVDKSSGGWHTDFLALASQFGVTYGGSSGLSGTATVIDFSNPISNGAAGFVNSFTVGGPHSGVSAASLDFASVAIGPNSQTALGYLRPGGGRLGDVVFLTDFNTFDDLNLGSLDNNTLWTNLFDYTAVPEPSTVLLMATGLAGLVWRGGRQAQRSLRG